MLLVIVLGCGLVGALGYSAWLTKRLDGYRLDTRAWLHDDPSLWMLLAPRHYRAEGRQLLPRLYASIVTSCVLFLALMAVLSR
jgi:hypothetical protein